MNEISFLLPTRNTLPYTKLAYYSLRKYNPDAEIIILDDLSNDGTQQWMNTLDDDNLVKWFNDPINFPKTYNDQKFSGHTITYNIGATIAKGPILGVFHSDMICTENYTKNLIKHLKPKSIISATRVEPPIYPPDGIKHVKEFGIYHDEFKEQEFLAFVKEKESEHKDKISNHFFAPWIMYQDEYLELGGMNEALAPFPCEDSCFVERLVANDYNIIQSWDSLVYHYCSRGHRFTTGKVGIDCDYFKVCQERSLKKFVELYNKYPNPPNFNYRKT